MLHFLVPVDFHSLSTQTTGRFIHNTIPKVSLQPINWTHNEVLFFTDHMGLCLCSSKVSTMPKPHYVLVEESDTNPLCHVLPPHSLLPYFTIRSVANNSMS
ncbi:hypothetical protein AVEN_51692-1 [Araneus ventricosus]|uniref:Uncharacterized protein n=1 Tax=Araneus ventricosus TaxID=182803 RepID=A0A4Y2HS61_ARAVE|nr:hypothetical protein AVEN_51692-1 [Araneus ventricosus]